MHAPDEMTVDAASDDIIARIMQRMDEDSDDFPTEAESTTSCAHALRTVN